MRLNFIHLTLFFGISISSYAQVGIGTTEPVATLDIKNNDPLNTTISISTPNNENHLKLSDSGSLDIGTGSFSPDNKPGTEEYYLISQGPNKPPIWKQLTGVYIYSAMQLILKEYDNQNGTNGQTIPIIFDINDKSELIQDSNDVIAQLEDNQYIKILADGVYNISWNTTAVIGEGSTGGVARNDNSKLYYSSSKTNKNNFYVAIASTSLCRFATCNPFFSTNNVVSNSLTNKEVTLNLKANDYLFLDYTANVINSSTEYKLTRASIQIKKIKFNF